MVLKDTNIGRIILEHITSEKTASKKSINTDCVNDAKIISSGLAKVASLPYKADTYKSMQEMMKIASENINDLTSSLEHAQSRASSLEKAAEVRIIIDDMINMGAIDEHGVEEKVAELMSKDLKQIEIVKEAMKIVGGSRQGNMFFEIEKEASIKTSKSGIFDSVIASD